MITASLLMLNTVTYIIALTHEELAELQNKPQDPVIGPPIKDLSLDKFLQPGITLIPYVMVANTEAEMMAKIQDFMQRETGKSVTVEGIRAKDWKGNQ